MSHSLLLQSVENVLSLTSYRPSPRVDRSFSELVNEIVSSENNDAVISTKKRQDLRVASSVAESELERYWAQKIIDSADPQSTLGEFPYIDNYRDLVERELECLSKSGAGSLTSALIIGSGPLPLSAMQLQAHGITVDHNDASSSALALCESLLNALSIKGKHILGLGESVSLDKHYDLVVIAALAGATQEDKQRILDNVLPHITDNGRVLLRSARGARSLLYPELDAKAFRGVSLLHEYHPDDHVINSVLVYKKEEA